MPKKKTKSEVQQEESGVEQGIQRRVMFECKKVNQVNKAFNVNNILQT